MIFKVLELIITFKKYLLNTIHGQSVLEYSLLLVVIAVVMLTFFVNDFQPIKDIFNHTSNRLIERLINGTN
ncbi:MAG: hypothetical protein ABIA97_04165 [Candidatus Omnitrophota bacterium]